MEEIQKQLNRIEKKLDELSLFLNSNSIITTKIIKKEKQTPTIQIEISEQIEQIYILYKNKINNRSRLIEKAKQKIKARLKEYSFDELNQAIDKFSEHDWWMQNNAKRGLSWFFHSEDRIEQFLNLVAEKKKPKYELFHNKQPCKYFYNILKIYATWSSNWLEWNKNHPQYDLFILKDDGKQIKKGREAYNVFKAYYID